MKKEYYVFGVLGLVLLLLFAYESYVWYSPANPMFQMMQQMHGNMMRPLPWGYNPSFWIFLALVVIFAYYLLKEPKKDLSILEKRYMSGEITREEYLQIIRDLKK